MKKKASMSKMEVLYWAVGKPTYLVMQIKYILLGNCSLGFVNLESLGIHSSVSYANIQ